MDFNQMCRICLESNKQTLDIYTCYYIKTNRLYAEMLSLCTKIKPFEDDGLPRLICKDCSRQLKRTYIFNLQCEESEKKLKCHLDSMLKAIPNDETYIGSLDVKSENADANTQKDADQLGQELLSNSVKNELNENGNEDSCWDAEDDNLLLVDVTPSNAKNDHGVSINENEIRKKRGRKKKEYAKDEVPSPPMSKRPHQCDVCGKVLSTKSNLKQHKICHTDLRPYRCGECPATFRGHSALFQHKRTHSGLTPYHCEYCPKQFTRRTGLVNHIRMHTGEKQYSCDICFKSFTQSAQLSIHMKRHKGDKSYLCQDCGKGFPIQAELRVHQRIHNGEKPYSCHLCTKTFATSGNLSIHVRIHNKEIRYKCKECNRGFVTCSAYNVHLKRHKGQRDHRCECGKTFYTSSALKQHKVVHTGEKNYQCKICNRKFSQTSHLSRHFRRDHAKPNVPVPSSDYYKLVLPAGNRVESLFSRQKVQMENQAIKCEGT